jgi:hypothetical protein
MLSQVVRKVAVKSYDDLVAVNDFLDSYQEVKYDKNKKILVLTVTKNGVPYFLERILKSNSLLATLPMERQRVVLVESERVPGTLNYFYRANATEIPKGKQVAKNWMPDERLFGAYVDAKANDIAHQTQEHQFYSLFYQGNSKYNPLILLSVQKVSNGQTVWDWNAMTHPKDTPIGYMLIPIGTVKKSVMIDLLMAQ